METESPSEEIEQTLFTNNFWIRLTQEERSSSEETRTFFMEEEKWTEGDETDYQRRAALYRDLDQLAAEMRIQTQRVIQIMMVESRKLTGQDMTNLVQEAERILAPLFEAMIRKGYSPEELMS